MDQTQLDGNNLEQEFNGQAFQCVKKRGINEAFSQSHIVEMFAVLQAVASRLTLISNQEALCVITGFFLGDFIGTRGFV